MEQLTFTELHHGYQQIVPWWFRLANDNLITPLTHYTRHYQPDLIIWEPATYAAPLAAHATNTPHIRLTWSPDFHARTRAHYLTLKAAQPPHQRPDPLQEWLTTRAHHLGTDFTEDLITGQHTIDQYPPALSMHTSPQHLPMRYIPYNGPATIPPWLRTPPPRTRVALTLGTSATERLGGNLLPTHDILNALADTDADIIAALPRPHPPHPLPPNITLIDYVPMNALLPTCSAIIHHGGFGTLNTAIRHRLPQLLIPQLFDAPFSARRLQHQGAGLWLTPDQLTPTRLHNALHQLLTDPAHTHAAHRLHQQTLTQPTPAQLIPHLQHLTTR
ncbi:nucleotide disphospho-sugar-binding domain-containing protein, partial [Nocardiopsis dassonvillei]